MVKSWPEKQTKSRVTEWSNKYVYTNQFNAQIKITEIWKAYKDEDHPFKIIKTVVKNEERVTRAMTDDGSLKCNAVANVTKNTFINDSKKAWNKSPLDLKNASSLQSAKAIKKFVKMPPV